MNKDVHPDVISHEIRICAAPPNVFRALSQASERSQWWGADGKFRTLSMDSDLHVGGAWRMEFEGAAEQKHIVSGSYTEVREPDVLAFTWKPSWDPDGLITELRFELEDFAGATLVKLVHSGLTTQRSRTQHQGWPDILKWLKAYVERASPSRR